MPEAKNKNIKRRNLKLVLSDFIGLLASQGVTSSHPLTERYLLDQIKSLRSIKLLFCLIVGCCFFYDNVQAQTSLDFKKWQFLQSKQNTALNYTTYTPAAIMPPLIFQKLSLAQKPTPSVQSVPHFGQYHELGFFCKLDLRLDLTMKMPFRFRLGTLDAVNRKEGYYQIDR